MNIEQGTIGKAALWDLLRLRNYIAKHPISGLLLQTTLGLTVFSKCLKRFKVFDILLICIKLPWKWQETNLASRKKPREVCYCQLKLFNSSDLVVLRKVANHTPIWKTGIVPVLKLQIWSTVRQLSLINSSSTTWVIPANVNTKRKTTFSEVYWLE